jgi:Kef-type K+ transport system membrane component KefB
MTDIVFSVRLWPSVIVLASHASRGYFAAIVDRTMVTSGQLPMRLAICLLILLILISQWFEIDFILGAFVAGAVVRAALPEYELKATAVRRNWLRFLCAAPRNRTPALWSGPWS